MTASVWLRKEALYMKLSKLIEKGPEIEISSISLDSRHIEKNSMFFCMDGLQHDGHDYIDEVIEKGAVCIIHTKDIPNMKEGIVYIKVENITRFLNVIASRFYGEPSKHMKIFGITGTNGKSTIASVIQDLHNHMEPCGYIGTISISYGDVVLPPNLTTPDAIVLHSTLKDMLDANMKACALEVSSHGLELNRVGSVDFDVAVFSNLTYDHLDFHGTFENYRDAKKKLFTNLKESGVAVINADDPYGSYMVEECKARVVTYGIQNDATYRADHIHIGIDGSSFMLYYGEESYEIHTNLVATYNIYNLLAAIAALKESGLPLEAIVSYISQIRQIDGRMERIDEGQAFNVIVDFAHTPDGLKKVFEYAKQITPNDRKIIAVFGSAGKRDTKKRKVFGSLADEYCDNIILTEDDPRDEDPHEIADEIRSGIETTNCIYMENRYDAIRQAVESANVGDCVLLLGKGDEVFMYREFGREPWMGDHNAARKCIKKYCLGLE